MTDKVEKYNEAFTELSRALRAFSSVAKRLGFPVRTIRFSNEDKAQKLSVRTRRV